MVTLPAAGYIENDARTQAEAKQFLEDVRQFLEERFGLSSSILARSKNALFNGNFDFWQRGSTITTTTGGAYIADRWRHELVGASGSITVSRQAFTLGQTAVPGEPEYYYRANQTAQPATSTTAAEQRIESVRSFAGQSITVSFYAKADAAQTFELEVAQNFGLGGSPSAEVSLTQDLSITTSWALYTATFTLASISGKTLGSSGNEDYLGIRLNSTTGTNATFTLDLSRVQCEPGSGATPFDQRELSEEYQLIARYYTKSYVFNVPPGGTPDLFGAVQYTAHTTGANANRITIFYPVLMRTSPTMTYYNTNAANGNWRNQTGTADSGAAATINNSDSSCVISNPQVAGDNAGDHLSLHWTATAEL